MDWNAGYQDVCHLGYVTLGVSVMPEIDVTAAFPPKQSNFNMTE
jgi:hypothetical protein